MRHPDGSSVDPSRCRPGTTRVARKARPASAGTARRDRMRMAPIWPLASATSSPSASARHDRPDLPPYPPHPLGSRVVSAARHVPGAPRRRAGRPDRAAAARPGLSDLPAGRADRAARGLRAGASRARDRHQGARQDGPAPGRAGVGARPSTEAERVFAPWAPVRGALVARAAGKHIPVFIGADHHAAHPEVSRLRDLLAELDPQSAFRVSRLDEFFQAAAEGAKPTPLAGELRWSYRYAWTLQGVHATRAPLKRRYGEAELMLTRLAEPLAALARRAGGRDRRPLLELAWRGLVRCQFHDSIAGCVSDAVAHGLETRLGGVEALASEIVRGSVHDLAHHDPDAARARPADAQPTLVLWNPAARPRRGVAIADVTLFRRDVLVGPPGARVPREGEGYRPVMLATADGRAVPVQVLDRRVTRERVAALRHYPDHDQVDQVRIAGRAPPLPGLGLATVAIKSGAAAPGARPSGEGVQVKGRLLVNHWVEVAVEPTGALALHDRRSGQRFADMLRIEDGGDAGDTYSYCPPAGDRVARAAGPITVRRLAAGPLVAPLELTFEL